MTLGQKLKQTRLARGMTQSQVVGDRITRNMLSQIENDLASPSVGTLEYLPQKFRRDRERRARRERDLPHGAERGIVIRFNEACGVSHDLIDRLHNRIWRQTAILDGQIHRAA